MLTLTPLLTSLLLLGSARAGDIPFLRVTDLREVAPASSPLTPGAPWAWFDPAWSPDGARLSASGPRHHGLFVLDLDGGAIRTLVAPDAEETCGYRSSWLSSSEILCEERDEAAGHPRRVLDVTRGVLRDADPPSTRVIADRDDIVLIRDGIRTRLTQGEDRFFLPTLSPDGRSVVFCGLKTGLHVMDLTTRTVRHLGEGTRPAFTPDSRTLLFERVLDDGHAYTRGDILAFSLESGLTVPVLAAPASVERFPAISADGTRLAFVKDGALWVGRIEEVRP